MNKNRSQKGFIPLEVRETYSNNKKDKSLTGFTLIELLVVIAIIGILAAVLLVSLNNQRNKATQAAVKLETSQMRTVIENYAIGNNNNYGDPQGVNFTSDPDYIRLKNSISSKGFGVGGFVSTDGRSYCVNSAKSLWNFFWCIDSSGYAGPPATRTMCFNTRSCR